MGFEKLITSIVTNSIRNAMRFSVSIDSLQEQFDNACPDEDKLSSIVEQKNLLNNSITQLQNSLSSLTKTNNTVSTITDSLDKAITIIKAIPIPTSVPPGVGIPTNFITGLSGTLENLKGIVKENKGLTVGFNDSINVISTSLQDMQAKINSLDSSIIKCSQTQILNTPEGIKTTYINNVLTKQPLSIEDRLSPTSSSPYIYKGYKLILQFDPNNKFQIPRRRVIGIKEDLTVISKLTPDGYSYTSDAQILIDDIKFTIDNPNFHPQLLTAGINQEVSTFLDEAQRGYVQFFNDDNFSIQVGSPLGYSEGKYKNLYEAGFLVYPGGPDNKISSLKVGRGLRLTIFKAPEFLTFPQSNNIDDDYKIFEHPLSSEDEYLEIKSLWDYGFNDLINSFIIDKTIGGSITSIPQIQKPIYKPSYALKRRSYKKLIDINNNLVAQGDRYNGYVQSDGSVASNINFDVISRGDTESDAKQDFIKKGLVNGLSNYDSNFEQVIYFPRNIYEIGISATWYNNGTLVGNYHVENNSKVFYVVKIS